MILRRGCRGGGCACWSASKGDKVPGEDHPAFPSGSGTPSVEGDSKEISSRSSTSSSHSSSSNSVVARVLPTAPGVASGLARILSSTASRKEREEKEAAAREEERIKGIVMAAMVSDSKLPKDVKYDPHAGENPFELPHLADFLPLPPVESTYRAKSGPPPPEGQAPGKASPESQDMRRLFVHDEDRVLLKISVLRLTSSTTGGALWTSELDWH